VIVAGCALFAPAEDLDAALEAQKKKAHRRVYTDSALLQNQDLTVPQTPSEIEAAADKEFYEAEERLNVSSAPRPKATPPAPVKTPAQNKNWLTPALMEKEEEKEEELQWSDYSKKADFHNQEGVTPKMSEERELIDQMVQERLQQPSPDTTLQTAPTDFQPLPKYAAPQSAPNRAGQGPATPSYRTPADIARMNLLPSVGSGKEKPSQSGLKLFAPSSAIASPEARDNSLQFQRSTLNPHIRTSAPQAPLNMLNQNTKPFSPLEQIRKSSPINQRDPFSENYMPEFKKSIWE